MPSEMASAECGAELQRPKYYEEETGKDVNERQNRIAREHVIQRRELRQFGIGWDNGRTVAVYQNGRQMRRPPRHGEYADQRQEDDHAPYNAAAANAGFQAFHLYHHPSR